MYMYIASRTYICLSTYTVYSYTDTHNEMFVHVHDYMYMSINLQRSCSG